MEMRTTAKTGLEVVEIDNETFYKISDVDAMRPFFMSIVSDSDHWLFVSSNGGISAGRKNADFALFPYYTDDKITESAEITGSKTIFRVTKNNTTFLWEPFSIRGEGRFAVSRAIYQNKWCNTILFEEINHDLQLSFRYSWSSSDLYGFVKQSKLVNFSEEPVAIHLLDGLQNILPYGIPADLQTTTSNLADAYKRAELIPETGLGIFALSAIIIDKAEPAEALKANLVWSLGLDSPTYLLSSLQLQSFRKGQAVRQEEDIKGEKGAYFVSSHLTLAAQSERSWMMVANVNQNHSAVIALSKQLETDADLTQTVLADIDAGTQHLLQLTGAADGFQYTSDGLKDTRHYANVLFSIMRGGIFDNNYQLDKSDFLHYLQKANRKVADDLQSQLAQLPNEFSLFALKAVAEQSDNPDFIRLAATYLPLTFSRRHGDPSRPWNKFSINTRNELDGAKILDYQGNWRDIFQNWEALAHSYPAFIEGMIAKFLNASTFDGYNPYRITKDGFDWETIEPDNPWSYIGYWGDHQIIYLLKFLEFAEQHRAGALGSILNAPNYVYANVPYRIKSYQDIVSNPKSTIDYDHLSEKRIQERIRAIGGDGALLTTTTGDIYHVTFAEKILATVLSKLSNFVPEGGIWMNTQRPEWNDANNALVGNGVSVVTLNYLRRFLAFFQTVLSNSAVSEVSVSAELHVLFSSLAEVFAQYRPLLSASVGPKNRKTITDALGMAGSQYRHQIYEHGFSGTKQALSIGTVSAFVNTALQFIEHTLNANKRPDGLYHAYNLLSFKDDELTLSYLSEMLEGQVAVLSSGLLSAEESLQLLDALKQSKLYRNDQNSYLLYPNKALPGFLAKNTMPAEAVAQSVLLTQLLADNNRAILEKDINGAYHFNGNIKNADDLSTALNRLDKPYISLVETDKALVLQVFEDVFNHKEFTGRSGTFFAYEGLGSIYWHMVSKLALAVQETCLSAIQQSAQAATINGLIAHYYDISEGIGVHKSPELYGAFPVTPYSHTPLHKGAQQPGMTGQVKEDILCRFGELGVYVRNGQLVFNPVLLRQTEFLTEAQHLNGALVLVPPQQIQLAANSLLFTFCGLPIVYEQSDTERIELERSNGTKDHLEGLTLSEADTELVLHRRGLIRLIRVFLNPSRFRN